MAFRFDYGREVLGRPVEEKKYLGEAPTAQHYSQGVVDRFAMEVFRRPTGINGDFGMFTNKEGRKEMGNFTALLQNGPFGFGMTGAEPQSSSSDSSNIG